MTEKDIKILKESMDATQEIMKAVMGNVVPPYDWDDEPLANAFYALNAAYLHLCTDYEGMQL